MRTIRRVLRILFLIVALLILIGWFEPLLGLSGRGGPDPWNVGVEDRSGGQILTMSN